MLACPRTPAGAGAGAAVRSLLAGGPAEHRGDPDGQAADYEDAGPAGWRDRGRHACRTGGRLQAERGRAEGAARDGPRPVGRGGPVRLVRRGLPVRVAGRCVPGAPPARASQRPPAGEWRTFLILAGRGFGKTRSAAEWVRHRVETGAARRIALVGATAADVRDVMVEGPSGLLAVCPPWNRPRYEPSKRRLTWPGGAVATTFTRR